MADETTPTDSTFHALALSRWQAAETHENHGEGSMRFEGEKDLLFLNLQQWEENDKTGRAISLTIDQIGEPYRQLVGSIRSSKPAIQVNPVDNGADIDTAEVFQGLIRHVEINGGAKAAREEAFKGAVGPGWGYYRLYTEREYTDVTPGMTPLALFDQCIRYQPIENQFTVWRDPSCPLHEPWKCRWAFQVEDVPTEEFKVRWPNALATQADAFASTGIKMPDWFPETSVRVADYFYVEEIAGEEYALLQNGQAVLLKDAPAGVPIVQRVKTTRKVVKLAKMTGAEILEGNDAPEDWKSSEKQPVYQPTEGREQPWPHIPIVPMFGEALTVKGKRTLRGIVRAARDPQRMYNYQNSELVYELALSPKSKVLMAEGQEEGHAEAWKRAPSEAFPYLLYKPTSLMGQPVGPPVVAQFTDPAKIQALVIAINQHKADLRSTTGWYDATDPSRKNTDQSGRAILARKEAQSESAVNYKDNFGQALLFEGMLLLGAIPKLFAREGRILRILGEDDKPVEPVTVGQPFKGRGQKRGVEGVFQWGAGRFDVTVSIGTSYTTRRQEASDTQMALVEVAAKVHPPMAAALLPAAIRNMDIPGSQDLADTAERALPPELRQEEGEGEASPEAMKAQLQQAQQQMQEMGQVIQGLQEAVKTDQVKAEADMQKATLTAQADAQQAQQSDAVKIQIAQMEIESKERIEAAKLQAEMHLAQMKIDAELEKARITAEAAAQARREGFAHDDITGERGHVHALEQQASKPNGSGAQA